MEPLDSQAGQREPEHALRAAPEPEAKASLYGQKPSDGAAGVSAGIALEAVERLTSRDSKLQ